jgi:hypothetical protein
MEIGASLLGFGDFEEAWGLDREFGRVSVTTGAVWNFASYA